MHKCIYSTITNENGTPCNFALYRMDSNSELRERSTFIYHAKANTPMYVECRVFLAPIEWFSASTNRTHWKRNPKMAYSLLVCLLFLYKYSPVLNLLENKQWLALWINILWPVSTGYVRNGFSFCWFTGPYA